MGRAIPISFVDFTHTGKTIDTNYFPLGVCYVAAYTKSIFGDAVDIEIYKYPDEYSLYLKRTVPQVACFSNFSWNSRLSYEYAKQIKLRSPHTVTVFGGPNYGNAADEQERFLTEHPYIDFYVVEEGELVFVQLLKELMAQDFNIHKIAESGEKMPGVHFYKEGTFVRNEPANRIDDLSVLPSPVLAGFMDKFIDGRYIPLIQTTRGCPYSCTYCHDGDPYQNKIRRFPKKVYESEIEYIARRTSVPHLAISDLNFGISEDDFDTARYISKIQKRYHWPRTVDLTAAKNHKERIASIVELLGNSYLMGASVQSTDERVLSSVKRTKLPFDDLVKLAKKSANYGGNSFSEVILCLPDDTKEAHFKSVFDLLDAGMDEIRMYQFILLTGTEAGSEAARKKYGYKTKWRVLPRCFGKYQIFGKECAIAEIHEVCVGNNTMSHQEYLDCRKFNITVEIFNNGKVFGELFRFLDFLGISRADIIREVYRRAINEQGMMNDMLKEFEKNEEKNFFDTRAKLEEFISKSDNIDCYLSGKYGTNQIMTFRADALLHHLTDNAGLIFDIVYDELRKCHQLDEDKALYLKELREYILVCRGNLFSVDKDSVKKFHFDFVKLFLNNFMVNPLEYKIEEGVEITIGHSDESRKEIEGNLDQYDRSADGLGHFMQRGNIFRFYREPRYTCVEGQKRY